MLLAWIQWILVSNSEVGRTKPVDLKSVKKASEVEVGLPEFKMKASLLTTRDFSPAIALFWMEMVRARSSWRRNYRGIGAL